jgi:anti-sigma regulatory factor (Ser/Thr protein kinase)
LRRNVENVSVLSGGRVRRSSNTPGTLHSLLVAANSEIERFNQVEIHPTQDIQIQGFAFGEVVHLLSELLDNATTFTPPTSKVELRAQLVNDKLWIQVRDKGLGIPPEKRERFNRLLDQSTPGDRGDLLAPEQIGLPVVKTLAGYHGIHVSLEGNKWGGTDADVLLPPALIVIPKEPAADTPPQRAATAQARDHDLVGSDQVVPGPHGRHVLDDDRPAELSRSAPTPADAEDLPVRTPGRAFSAVTPTDDAPATEVVSRPALPQRTAAETHLPPGLRDAPAEPTMVPGHNVHAAAAARQGLLDGMTQSENSPLTSVRTQGDSQWPTT